MRSRVKKGLVGVVIAGALALGGPTLTAAAWESVGLKTEYPSEGGTWQYGFENVMLRSYYTVSRCHGSTVQKTEHGHVVETSRSIDTASGRTSIAEIRTANYPNLEGWYFYRTC